MLLPPELPRHLLTQVSDVAGLGTGGSDRAFDTGCGEPTAEGAFSFQLGRDGLGAVAARGDAVGSDLLLLYGAISLASDRGGDLQRCGGAVYLRQHASGSRHDLYVSGGE